MNSHILYVWMLTLLHVYYKRLLTDQFSGPGRAVSQVFMCGCFLDNNFFNKMTFDLYIWRAGLP